MKALFFLSLNFGILYTALSQHPTNPYSKVILKDKQPIWYETIIDSNMINQNCDGYNRLLQPHFCKNVLHDDFIYTALNTISSDNEGYYIEKRDATDGNLIWKYSFTLKDVEKQEVPRHISIDEDNNVIVLSQRRIANIGGFPPFSIGDNNLRFVQRKLNGLNGSLIETKTLPNDDSSSYKTAYEIFNFSYTTSYIFKEKENYRYIQNYIYDPSYILSVLLDPYGKVIGTVDTLNHNERQEFLIVEQIDEQNYFLIVKENEELYFQIYDPELQNLKSSFKIANIGKIGRLNIEDISNNKVIIENYFTADSTNFFVFDYSGELLNGFKKSEYYAAFNMFLLENELYAVGLSDSLEFIKITNGEIQILSKFKPENELTYFMPSNFFKASNNTILLLNNERAFFYNDLGSLTNDKFAQANSLMLFDFENLGIVTSIKNHTILSDFTFFPNPSSSTVEIKSDAEYDETIIYNLDGKILLKEINNNNTIDVSSLANGTYLCELKKDGKVMSSKVKFVKAE